MEMIKRRLFDKKQTVKEIDRIARRYGADIEEFFIKKDGVIIPLHKLSLKEFYNLVRAIPYQRDQRPIEILIRPGYMIKNKGIGLDCKKKTILMASYMYRSASGPVRFRYVGSSQRPDKRIHHIYLQVLHDGQWKNVDATYPENNIFENKQYTKVELL
jgi:hypothetical protein